MSLKSGYLSGICPNCDTVLDFAADEASVLCHSCKRNVAVKDIQPIRKISEKSRSAFAIADAKDGVVSARAALIYFNNFCERFDWQKFAMKPELTISDADALAKIALLKFSDDPISYVLDFRRIAVPMFKKIETLSVLEIEIIEHYKKDDISDLFEYVDLYSTVTTHIAAKRDEITARLENDLKLAAKFGADEAIIADLEKSLELFRDAVGKVSACSDIESIPGYVRAKELYDERLKDKLDSAGIDAEATYNKAEGMMNEGHIDGALHLYHLLGEYKSSAKIIKKHSTFFEFRDLLEAAGHTYTVRDKKPIDEAEKENGSTEVFSLYEANSSVPAMSDVSKIIATWGTRIFFMRADEKICCFNTRSEELYANVLIMDSAMRGDYAIDAEHPIYFSSDRSKFFIRKVIRASRSGRKRKKAIGNRDNNYSVICIDMDEMSCTTVIPEVIDVMDFCDDRFFYTAVDKDGAASFRVLSLSDGRDEEVLGKECVIHKVIDNIIIYSVWAPSKYNLNLYSISIHEKTPTMLASNVSGYYTSYEGKVFYTVGANENARLYSVLPDGKGKCEITAAVGKIIDLRSGWIYYVSGEGRNACLMKVSTDGERTVTVASRFKKLIKMTSGYVYYVSSADDLCVVRSDGNGESVIAEDVEGDEMIIDDKHVYYLRREFVGKDCGDENGMGKSLYATDLSGKGLIKLAHNVTAMKDYSDTAVQITSESVNDYMVTTPISRKKSRTEYVTRNVVSYELLDKTTGERTSVMDVGAPQVEYVYCKGGLFSRKKKKLASTVENVTVRRGYERLGVTERGYVRNGEVREKMRKKDEKAAKKAAKIAAKEAEKASKKEAKKNKKESGKKANGKAEGDAGNAS